MYKQAVILSIALLFTVACNPSAKLVKQADTKRLSGYDEDAATLYYNALLSKPQNEKAKQGLLISAQHVLNDKFTSFNKLVVENNVDEAMKVYKNAENYNKAATSVGVELHWPNEYDEVYADIRSEYISKLYDQALLQMKDKNYEQAEQTFERIALLDTTYKGITVLRLNTVLEPLYQHGLIELKQGKYKQAYQTFSKIVTQDDGYKDSKALKEEANQKATTNIGVLPIYSLDSTQDLSSLAIIINDKLLQKTFAYVQVQSFNTTNQTLQSRGWGVIANAENAAEAGRTLGLKYVLWVEIKEISFLDIPLTTEMRTAYEAFSENILNPYTGTYSAITKFQKVQYEDTYQKRSVTIKASYKLIATNNGNVVLGDDKEHTQKDEAHQLVYAGNLNNIYDELPTGNYLPPPNQAWRDLFTNVKREPLSKDRLTTECLHSIGRQIAQSVIGYYK